MNEYNPNQMRIDETYSLGSSFVALFHTNKMHGYAQLIRGLLGWEIARRSWELIEPKDQYGPVYYWHEMIHYGRDVAELVTGRVKLPNVLAVAVTFDDGQTLRQTITGERFVIYASGHYDEACELRVFDKAEQIIQAIKLPHPALASVCRGPSSG